MPRQVIQKIKPRSDKDKTAIINSLKEGFKIIRDQQIVDKGEADVFQKNVRSSNIKTVMYDRNRRRLTLLFNSKRAYVYENVPELIYYSLLAANSKGIFFNRFIKYRYKYKEFK